MEYVNGELQALSNTTVQPLPTVILYPAEYPGFILALRICVGITSILSIFGGLGIVIAYSGFLRPKPDDDTLNSAKATADQLRQIIVFLSIADILVAWGHLWGVSTPLKRFLDGYSHYNTSAPTTDQQCSVQAVLTIYGTVASFMWTVILTMLVFVLIKSQQKKKVQRYFGRKAFTIYHLLCWLVPLIEICILARLDLLGYDTVDVGEYPNNIRLLECLFIPFDTPMAMHRRVEIVLRLVSQVTPFAERRRVWSRCNHQVFPMAEPHCS